MDENLPPQNFFVDLLKRNLLIFILISLGIVLAVVGLIQYFGSNKSPSAQIISANESEAEIEQSEKASSSIVFDIAGQVQNPGVYTLPAGSRVADVIEAAGGFSQGADREYIAKRINLAQKVTDGGKIYIPSTGEPVVNANQSGSNMNTDVSVMGAVDTAGLIDINSASEAQLDTLPRVGPVTAKKIIDNRPYKAIEELVSKKVVGQAAFEGLRDKIVAQ